ncbi:restriction endonuclease [Pelotomaculum propionicicum]|uniref:restriction endonuclease n=1 Tax=Pelotomaculum propionicicum TaxID=258475 RepID=UPI003B814301
MNRFRGNKLLSIRGRNFRPSFARWRERRDKGAVLRYFFQKPKEDARTLIGKSVDYIGGLLLVWLAGFLLLLNLTGKPAASLAISLLLLAADAAVLKKVLRKRDKRRKIQQGFWLAGQRFMDDILRLPIREFKPYIRDMLNSLPGFQEVTLRADGKKQYKWDGLIDMKGIYKGVPLGVKCSRPDGDRKISSEEVRSFAGALQGEGLKNGIYITSGDFDAGVIQVTRESFRGGAKIMLVNRYGLVDLARQAGWGVFREDVDLSGVSPALKKRKQNSLDVFLESAFGNRKKAKSYFVYGLLLYGGYLILKDTTTFSLVYLLFTVINLLLGAGSLLFGKTLDQTDPLAGLGPEK